MIIYTWNRWGVIFTPLWIMLHLTVLICLNAKQQALLRRLFDRQTALSEDRARHVWQIIGQADGFGNMNQKKNECPRRFDHAVKGNREITAVMSEGKSDKEIVCVCQSMWVIVCAGVCARMCNSYRKRALCNWNIYYLKFIFNLYLMFFFSNKSII